MYDYSLNLQIVVNAGLFFDASLILAVAAVHLNSTPAEDPGTPPIS